MKRRTFFKGMLAGSAGMILFPSFKEKTESGESLHYDDLDRMFLNPPSSSGPWVMWEWLDGNVTREGITLDLEAMKRMGFSGAVCSSSDVGLPRGNVEFGSKAWLDALEHTIREASRLGLQIFLHHSGDGWLFSESGISPDMVLQQLVYSEARISSGSRLKIKLPQPLTRMGTYRDIAVLAFPTPAQGTELSPGNKFFDPGSAINLTPGMNKKGVVKWDVPFTGNWTILRIGHTPVGEKGNNPRDPACGLDRLSKTATDVCFDWFTKNLPDKLTFSAGNPFAGFIPGDRKTETDFWSAGFEMEFEKRRHYSLVPWLPVLTGKVTVTGKATEKLRVDIHQTHEELLSENYFNRWKELCQQHGLRCHIIIDPERKTEKPKSPERFDSNDIFTAVPAPPEWTGHPFGLKTASDGLFLSGCNRLLFPGFLHQPYTTGLPGMSLKPYGSLFDRNNTWSSLASGFTDYIRRTQFLLQKGNSDEYAADSPDSGGVSSIPDFSYTSGNADANIRFIHRSFEGIELYFISNRKHTYESMIGSFRITSMQPEIWNPETGEILPVPVFDTMEERLFMPIELLPSGTLFVMFRKEITNSFLKRMCKDGQIIVDNSFMVNTGVVPSPNNEAGCKPPVIYPALSFHTCQDGTLFGLFLQNGTWDFTRNSDFSEETVINYITTCFEIPLPGSWTVYFPEGSRAPEIVELIELVSLTQHSNFNIRHFSGTCRYETLFYLADSDFTEGRKFLLDLGRVEGVARVLINGTDAGTAWKEPCRLDVSAGVRKGENILGIEVATLWHNRLVGDEHLPAENEYGKEGYILKFPEWYQNNQPKPGQRNAFSVWQGVDKNDPLLESGLLGPVKLILGEEMLI